MRTLQGTKQGFQMFPPPRFGWEPIAVADMNGNGVSDVVWKHSANGNIYSQLIAAKVVAGGGVIGNAIDKDFLCSGDFDANARHELVFIQKGRNAANNPAPVMWFPDATGLALTTTTALNRVVGLEYSVLPGMRQCRDNDADAKAEIILRSNYGGMQAPAGMSSFDFIWCMNGAAVKADAAGSSGLLRNVDSTWVQVANGDWRADGKFGVWWRRDAPAVQLNPAPTGEHYCYPLTGNTIGATEGAGRTVADLNWDIIGSGQFDGLLGWDILFRNPLLAPAARGYIYTLDNAGVASPFITANEGVVVNLSAFDGYNLIGTGNFQAGPATAVTDCLWWHPLLRIAKLATITFAFVGTAGNNFTIDSGTVIANPP